MVAEEREKARARTRVVTSTTSASDIATREIEQDALAAQALAEFMERDRPPSRQSLLPDYSGEIDVVAEPKRRPHPFAALGRRIMDRTRKTFLLILGVTLAGAAVVVGMSGRNPFSTEGLGLGSLLGPEPVHVTIASSVTKKKWLDAAVDAFKSEHPEDGVRQAYRH